MVSKFNTIIETNRLLLRPFTMDDVEASYQMNLDPEVSRYTGDGGVVDIFEMRNRIKDVIEGDYAKYGFGRFVVEWKETNEFIGFSGLKFLPDYDFVDLGYRFLQRFWGKGIATEAANASLDFAFQELKLNKVHAFAIRENQASTHVIDKLGFSFEKEIVDDGIKFDQYVIHSKH